jgi:hypothetical protein
LQQRDVDRLREPLPAFRCGHEDLSNPRDQIIHQVPPDQIVTTRGEARD